MSLTYKKGERVLCHHGPQIYEAKVYEVREWDTPAPTSRVTGLHYLVHYQGWKDSWDEWVQDDRLLKLTADNILLQKSLRKNPPKTSSFQDGAGSSKNKKHSTTSRGVKRVREEMDGPKSHNLHLNVPDELKAIVVKDHQAVTEDKMLVSLPRSPTVQEVLFGFRDWILSSDPPPPNVEVVPLIVSGLQTYFDRALGANLLYTFERPKYGQIRAFYITGQNVEPGTDVDMSTIYGAEHLLRMLVTLPRYFAGTSLDGQSVDIIKYYVHELFKYMVQEKDSVFQSQYHPTDEQYQKIASGGRLR